jgi:hypothetical protein
MPQVIKLVHRFGQNHLEARTPVNCLRLAPDLSVAVKRRPQMRFMDPAPQSQIMRPIARRLGLLIPLPSLCASRAAHHQGTVGILVPILPAGIQGARAAQCSQSKKHQSI